MTFIISLNNKEVAVLEIPITKNIACDISKYEINKFTSYIKSRGKQLINKTIHTDPEYEGGSLLNDYNEYQLALCSYPLRIGEKFIARAIRSKNFKQIKKIVIIHNFVNEMPISDEGKEQVYLLLKKFYILYANNKTKY